MNRTTSLSLTTALAAVLAVAPVPVCPLRASDEAPSPRGQLQGSAFVRRNVPVVGAVVLLRPLGETSDLRATTTDVRGEFRIEGLEDGRYRLEVAHDGFATVVKEDVDLRAPFRAVVEVTMTASPAGLLRPSAPANVSGGPQVALSGVVRDREGRGTGEVRLRIIREDGRDDPRERVTTAAGEFAFDGLNPGRWRIELQGAGLLPIRAIVSLSEDTSLQAVLVPQPAGHAPAIEDLMPREEPIPPS